MLHGTSLRERVTESTSEPCLWQEGRIPPTPSLMRRLTDGDSTRGRRELGLSTHKTAHVRRELSNVIRQLPEFHNLVATAELFIPERVDGLQSGGFVSGVEAEEESDSDGKGKRGCDDIARNNGRPTDDCRRHLRP